MVVVVVVEGQVAIMEVRRALRALFEGARGGVIITADRICHSLLTEDCMLSSIY